MSDGIDIDRFAQSLKWLQHLSPAHRPPMCDVNGKHFYIFEPVQLNSADVVVPIFFYQYKMELYGKCLTLNSSHVVRTAQHTKITIPGSLSFDDPQLTCVPVNQFEFDYSEIQLGNGSLLIQACAGINIYGELLCYSYFWWG